MEEPPADFFSVISTITSVIRSPLRLIWVDTLLPKATDPLMVCSMDSTAKLV